MGTSSNHRSPDVPSWRLARAMIGSDVAPPDQQSKELWRAASADPAADLIGYLGSERVYVAAKLSQGSSSPKEAAQAFGALVQQSGTAPFLDATTSRAMLRTVAKKGGMPQFAGELLAELIGHYASRDLPSYVGARGRIQKTSESIALKVRLQQIARDACKSPKVEVKDAKSWGRLIRAAVEQLVSKK